MGGLRRSGSENVTSRPIREDISDYIGRGWLLVAIDKISKMPLPEPMATRNVDEAMRWSEQGIGYAIATGRESGIVALKVHAEHPRFNQEKNGEASLRKILGPSKLMTACSKGRGLRLEPFVYVFLAPEETIPSKEEIAPGLDFLGEGGYFLPASGSMRVAESTEIAPLPDWLRSLAAGESSLLTEQVAAGNFSVLRDATPYETAKAYSRLGWQLLAIDGEAKRHGKESLEILPPEHWERNPDDGIAVAAGSASGVVGLWIGSRAAENILLAGRTENLLMSRVSPGELTILYFRSPEERFGSTKLSEYAEYAGEGDFLPVPPSTIRGVKLRWARGENIREGLPDLPQWLRRLLTDAAELESVKKKLRAVDAPKRTQAAERHLQGEGEKSTEWVGIAARKYAERGWCVFPLKPGGKTPRTRRGFKEATTDREQITEWWNAYRSANIGMATGAVSGVVVLDVDTKKGQPGLQSLAELEAEHGPMATLRARTPSGGLHLFFRAPASGVGCKAGFLPGLDFRGDGGYIVVAPSRISGKEYCWENPNVEPAEMPDWLIAMVGARSGKKRGKDSNVVPHERITFREALAGVQEGNRNDTIFRLACRLRQEGWSLDEASVIVRTAAEKCEPPLPEEEAMLCLESAWRYDPMLALTDMGNAERFVSRCGDRVRYVPDKDRWLVWKGHYWETNLRAVFSMAKSTVRSLRDEAEAEEDPKQKKQILSHGRASESKESLENMMEIAGAELSVRAEDIDRPGLAAFADGVFDPSAGGIRPGRRDDLLTRHLPVPFDSQKPECRRWLQRCGVEVRTNPAAVEKEAWNDLFDRWLAERCELGSEFSTKVKELKEDFVAWAGEQVTDRRFGSLLVAKGFQPHKASVYSYRGLRLRRDTATS